MTSCDRLDAYLDRQLDGDEVETFEAHTVECAGCHAAIEQWRSIETDVREIAEAQWEPEPNPYGAAKLVRRATMRGQRVSRPATGRRLVWGMAAAAVPAR